MSRFFQCQYQVSISIHITAKFMLNSQLHHNNFDRWSCPLIDQQRLTWPDATMALPGLSYFQVSVSWLFTAVANKLHGAE